MQDNSPICLANRKKDLFAGLETGDRVPGLISGGIAESYLGQAGAKAVIKLSEGETKDISPNVLAELEEPGWWMTTE